MENYYQNFMNTISQSLSNMGVTLGEESISQQEGLAKWVELTKELVSSKGTLYFAGNGASAAMSAHMSADAFKNGNINARCLNESSLMTAIGNDIDFSEVFSYPIGKFSESKDQLITISSSGNSPNIVKALQVAKEKGMKTITLSGMSTENKSRSLGDLNFYIPSKSYGIVESTHQTLLHCWLDCYMDLAPE